MATIRRNSLLKMFMMFVLILSSMSLLAQGDPQPQPTPEDDEITIEVDVSEAESLAQDAVDLTEDAATAATDTVNDWTDRLISVPRNDVIRVLFVVLGVVMLFAGWRIYEFIILLAGMLIGASILTALVPPDDAVLQFVALLLGAFIGGVLAYFLYYAAVFVVGAYVGITLVAAIATALTNDPVSSLLLLLGAIIGGIVLLGLSSELLVLISALVGAQLLTLGLNLPPIWTLIFLVVGVIVQIAAARYYG
ncbi:MAG: DUF4203 domain-containing protein, partial [Phormidesmis sp.]